MDFDRNASCEREIRMSVATVNPRADSFSPSNFLFSIPTVTTVARVGDPTQTTKIDILSLRSASSGGIAFDTPSPWGVGKPDQSGGEGRRGMDFSDDRSYACDLRDPSRAESRRLRSIPCSARRNVCATRWARHESFRTVP